LDDLIYLQPYLDYFDLFPYSGTTGNERYYDFVWGNVHFFSVNSCIVEPDGYVHPSVQSAWLETQLNNCIINHSHWKFVYFHHAPYSSGSHGSVSWMQWPFKEWGADVVMAGHDHTYERLLQDDFPYFVNGLGGKNRYAFDPPIPGSIVRYREKYGAMLMTADESRLTFSFFSVDNELIDFYEIINPFSSLMIDISVTAGRYSLEQNYPNPFNPITTIQYQIPELSFVTLKVYDVLGSEVALLVNEKIPAGSYAAEFDANKLPSGIYFYKLQVYAPGRAGSFVETKKMILLK
ncbi:MAG: T9SS type A sorting domain-containing protein, partial [Ignavibacteriaceae bacterium]